MTTLTHRVATISMCALLAGCGAGASFFPPVEPGADNPGAPQIRQPVLPEYLVGCRGHVLVPALGMTLVPRYGQPPPAGQFLREENLTAPYRIIRAGDSISAEHSPERLNVEVDRANRIIGLACG
ncbi:MAG: hypothetical protein KDE14_03470 [Rhodobacteraceae bacterium]|nr:hypothetical protein [Paracoccaceae bacterium]